MGVNSEISWCDNTFNPWWGCMKVSEGCKNCYAETLDNRYHNSDSHWGPKSSRKPMSENYWNQPLKWEKQAIKEGRKIKVFCASMADIFEDHTDVCEWRARLLKLIRATPNLIWQILTKRPENILLLAHDWVINGMPDNVWIGTSVENQAAADERIPHLLKVPAEVRFLSCEPLLGSVDLSGHLGLCDNGESELSWNFNGWMGINWVIAGGESGPGARPMHPAWIRSLKSQCKQADVPFFFKQWGNWHESDLDEGLSISKEKRHLWPDGKLMYNVGKKEAGSLLYGTEYKEFPI